MSTKDDRWPNRLQMTDGQLSMKDGSVLAEYLAASPTANIGDVVILSRAAAVKMDAEREYYYQRYLELSRSDERFAICA